ncbi:UNVERIFIED_CONTAM: hypothetical protein Slati_3533600 [Sesamum latifolium]|uniref:Uncharacterized protein n=1 Tax=Sesamum latifolium TaxID=2727402 RepID=A0AAW2UKW2_9LAMI
MFKHSKFGVSNKPISLLRQSFGIPRTENSVVREHAEQDKTGEELKNSPKQAEKSNQVGEEHPKVFVPKPPFSKRFSKSKKEEEEKDIFETLRKVEIGIENAMYDLGASINVMPLSIYESLNIGPLKETWVVLQLADRSIVYPEGVFEDEDHSLKPLKTKLIVDAGILSMEFDNEVVSFSIDGVTQNSNDMHSVFLIDFIDPLVRGNGMFDGGGASKLTKNKSPTSSPRTYKNKAFHEKISSRKKSSMDRQVLLNPHHHLVHYIEEVDLEYPTHLS